MKKLLTKILFIFFFCNALYALPIPENNKAKFDIIRKNKVIGSHIIDFKKNGDSLIIETNININVKVLFIPAYKFFHKSEEVWKNEKFLKIDAYTDFEDEREYFIKGKVEGDQFLASGMDGDISVNQNILPSNFWNINILKEKKLFDTQKGIIREIKVKDLGSEEIRIDDKKIHCKKFSFNASSNPKDKGPFPEYTLWYSKEDELIKFKFRNWKDNKIVSIIRNYQD